MQNGEDTTAPFIHQANNMYSTEPSQKKKACIQYLLPTCYMYAFQRCCAVYRKYKVSRSFINSKVTSLADTGDIQIGHIAYTVVLNDLINFTTISKSCNYMKHNLGLSSIKPLVLNSVAKLS
jgi:hypothetical protein